MTERQAEMNVMLERLRLMAASCRTSAERRCSVCPARLREMCQSRSADGESISAKIKRHMVGGIPVYYNGKPYNIVSYNYTVLGPMLSRVAGHMRVELLDRNGNSMLNCALEEIEFDEK